MVAKDLVVGNTDFTEEHVKKVLERSPWHAVSKRWVSCGTGNFLAMRMNYVSSILAILLTWGFAIWCIADKDKAPGYFYSGQSWVSQNFTWLYIGTQDCWCIFLIYLGFSRFGKIKLGADNEKPRYNDFTWFCMLFTCGVAVGLYVFGVKEPLAFYRSYNLGKTAVTTDAQRANQAIFMTVYHWGIHGWVPYILVALCAGIVSFRWGMPMTIRSCFYPLIGDHALGPVGDFIDALSIATTTFGVCTSLGLGVSQLSAGLQFIKNIQCDVIAECVKAGGTWDIDTYGANSCFGNTAEPTSCQVPWQKSAEAKEQSYYVIIAMITLAATVSVVTGLDNGIKALSKLAFSLGSIVMITIMFADNTWYCINVIVQSTGYYIQWIIQVGFDCEAFQQLEYEMMPTSAEGKSKNYFWGNYGEASSLGKLTGAGKDIGGPGFALSDFSSTDCGRKPNACSKGFISAANVVALVMAAAETPTMAQTMAGTQITNTLLHLHESHHSIDKIVTAYNGLDKLYPGTMGGMIGMPCGSGWNTTHLDSFTTSVLNIANTVDETVNVCSILTGTALPLTGTANNAFEECENFWSAGHFPKCPTTTTAEDQLWGTCVSKSSCSDSTAMYDDGTPYFMDWWTLFYWAWWITWAPFVGFFVALISRGRTVREVILGGFVCPTLFAIVWFSIFGGLAFKMQRMAEMALGVSHDLDFAKVPCGEFYSGAAPITPESKTLAAAGYYMLSCMPGNDQIYYLMQPYGNLTGFLHVFLWLGLVIYFLTSSDSGSMTDDIISASGLSAGRIPLWQKVFWCFTEGIVAMALVTTGGALGALQAVSIIIGLPFTILLCLMMTSLYRALKKEAGEEDILESHRFNTQLLDIFEGFKPHGGSPFPPSTHIKEIFLGLFVPAIAVNAAFVKSSPDSPKTAGAYGLVAQCLLICWFALQCAEPGVAGTHTISWLCFIGFALIVAFARGEMRRTFNVWDSPLSDLFSTLMMWPFVLAQIKMQADSDEAGPLYFASADEVIADMAAINGAPAYSGNTSTAKSVAPAAATAANDV